MGDRSEPMEDSGNEALRRLKFQLYNPRTESLKKYCEKPSSAGQLLNKMGDSHDEMVKSMNRKFADPALDLDNLIPRNGSWDVKKSLAGKLDRLEHRTRRAVLELAQKKAREEKDLTGGPIAETMSSGEE